MPWLLGVGLQMVSGLVARVSGKVDVPGRALGRSRAARPNSAARRRCCAARRARPRLAGHGTQPQASGVQRGGRQGHACHAPCREGGRQPRRVKPEAGATNPDTTARNARTSACRSGRVLRTTAHRPPGFRTAPDGHLRDQVAAQSKAALRALPKPGCRPCSVRRQPTGRPALRGRWRAAPDRRPARTPAATFPLVSAIPEHGLRSRERRFESCRGHCSKA